MKKYCKNVDILDIEFLELCAKDCLRKKWKRRDVEEYFARLLHESRSVIRQKIRGGGRSELIRAAALHMQREMTGQNISLVPIWYKEKIDASNGKTRWIGIQHISQQLYDYVAVYGMKDLLRRVGEHQYASIPGRGQTKGVRQIRKWLREKDVRYAVQLDVMKCFPSVPLTRVLGMIDKYVANPNLKWLVRRLLGTYKRGLAIGSYLSQYLCNLYMSRLYHEIRERMYSQRRGKRIPLAKHSLLYMDDILLLAASAKNLYKAVQLIIRYARDEMGLTIKDGWAVRQLQDGDFIDMMGYRIYRDHVTIRRRVFIRVRRAFVRARRHELTMQMAHKCISYNGVVENADSHGFAEKYKTAQIVQRSKEMISHESLFRRAAAAA